MPPPERARYVGTYSGGVHMVAVLSLKGGVGKTTVALGLASAALHRGARTLVVDLDPQGNAAASLDAPAAGRTMDELLRQPDTVSVRNAIAPSPWGEGIDVLAGSEELELLNEPGESAERAANLATALRQLGPTDSGAEADDPPDPDRGDNERPYDVVILDCPPSLGMLTRSALFTATSALLVSEPAMYAIAGTGRALEAVETIRGEHNPALRPAGVLVNRFRTRSYEHQFRIDELREEFGGLVMPSAIPDRLVLQQAQGACTPIHRWNSPAAGELALTFNMVLAKILRSDRAGRHRLSGMDDPSETHEPEDDGRPSEPEDEGSTPPGTHEHSS